MLSTGCMSTRTWPTSCRTTAGAVGVKIVRIRTTARRSAHIVAYREDDRQENRTQVPQRGDPTREFGRALDETQLQPRYDGQALRVPLWQPAFTRRREVFVGRIAMVGFFGIMVGEILTRGMGPILQLSYETGSAPRTISSVLVFLMVFNLFAGLDPLSATFSRENMVDISKRPPGPPASSGLKWPPLGITEWGFTKANEVFVGRLAMVGVWAAVLGEQQLGVGPIAQVAHYFGVPVDYGAVGWGLAAWTALAAGLAYINGNLGEIKGGKDIY